jgi:Family of unknown function (DUF6166)
MKTYYGLRRPSGACEAWVSPQQGKRRPLNPRFDLWNHSPSGFEWGYRGSGPAQLALAILADHLGDTDEALRLHQEFKVSVVAALDREGWTLTDQEIQEAIEALRPGGRVPANPAPVKPAGRS